MAKDAQITIRMEKENKELLEYMGQGNMSQGFEQLVGNYQALTKALVPDNFNEQEELCIAGACKTWIIETKDIERLSKMLEWEISDYFECEAMEANQWDVDRPALLEKIKNLSGPETFALIKSSLGNVFNKESTMTEMTEKKFKSWMLFVESVKNLDDEKCNFWKGYQRGLRRHFHRERFGTEEDHEKWLNLPEDSADLSRRELGMGYRAGFAGTDPMEIK